MARRTTLRSLLPLTALTLIAGLASGCTRTVYVETTAPERVYVHHNYQQTGGRVVGYQEFYDERIEIVEYVHNDPTPLMSYPQVYWNDRWYYNVNGTFVFYGADCACWCNHARRPEPIVTAWNTHHPGRPVDAGRPPMPGRPTSHPLRTPASQESARRSAPVGAGVDGPDEFDRPPSRTSRLRR